MMAHPFVVVSRNHGFDEFFNHRGDLSAVLLGSNGDEGSILASHLMPAIFRKDKIVTQWMTRDLMKDAIEKIMPQGTSNEVLVLV